MTELVYGVHAVHALLTQRHRVTHQLFVYEERNDRKIKDLVRLAESMQIPVQYLATRVMDQRFTNVNHQGIVATTDPIAEYTEYDLPKLLTMGKRLVSLAKQPLLILVLDGVTDPQNLGACLRSADASGVDFVVIPKDKNASITPVVSKVACGAAETVPVVRVTNLVRAMEVLQEHGVWIYGAAGEASENIYALDFSDTALALVMGSEGDGMRRLTKERCDGLFALPMLGSVSSLNVAVATGICLYEVVRQRLRT
jgi:23S rRNA (guanosine2251-2'-O)-methyltransferase